MRKKKLGIIYKYDERWIGGTYYIQNLIKALNILPTKIKPKIFVFTDNEEDFRKLQIETQYDYLFYWPFEIQNPFRKRMNNISRRILKRDIFDNHPTPKKIDILFSNPTIPFFDLMPNDNVIFWIPDFQEDHLPEFFSKEEVTGRKQYQKGISEKNVRIVFSSQDALSDFCRLYPNSIARKFVIPFAVTHDKSYLEIDKHLLLSKYNLPPRFFISPNQFWAHKNHKVIIGAMELLKKEGNDLVVVLTGKEDDYRHPTYVQDLKNLVNEKGLYQNVRFLGFIPRNDLLRLIDISLAVIQPSLFEGWSTVVEDSKALNKYIIASDLKVHREQLSEYTGKVFFKPESIGELAGLMINVNNDRADRSTIYNYQKDVMNYASKFLTLFE